LILVQPLCLQFLVASSSPSPDLPRPVFSSIVPLRRSPQQDDSRVHYISCLDTLMTHRPVATVLFEDGIDKGLLLESSPHSQ
jgi:hypothetical protein